MNQPNLSTRLGPVHVLIVLLTAITFLYLIGPVHSEDIPEHDEVTNLSLQMSEMNLAMRRLRKLIKRPDRQKEALRVILNVQTHALHAKGLTPSSIVAMPPEQASEALLDYRNRMIQLLETLLKLEKNVLASDTSAAEQTYSDIWALADDGHKKFRPESDMD